MKGLNIKGLCAQIKAGNWLHWSLTDGVHMITDRQWLITFSQLPKEVSVALFSKFADIPQEGEALTTVPFSPDNVRQKGMEFKKILDEAKKGSAVQNTKFQYQFDNKRNMTVFKREEQFIYVDRNILKAVDEYEGEILSNGSFSPVLFEDVNYLALPYHLKNNPEKEILELFMPHDHP